MFIGLHCDGKSASRRIRNIVLGTDHYLISIGQGIKGFNKPKWQTEQQQGQRKCLKVIHFLQSVVESLPDICTISSDFLKLW